jgi:hypothetical protein
MGFLNCPNTHSQRNSSSRDENRKTEERSDNCGPSNKSVVTLHRKDNDLWVWCDYVFIIERAADYAMHRCGLPAKFVSGVYRPPGSYFGT